MARTRVPWRRLPESWIPPAANPYVQFRSLVGHLYEAYNMPGFMTGVWLRDDVNTWEEDLYLHLAEGKGIRQFPFPFPFRLTRQGAVSVMQAASDLLPSQALRWAQVRSLGGDSRLARILCTQTLLSEPNEFEDFWESVIRFLIKESPISAEETLAIVRFVHLQRFLPGNVVWQGYGNVGDAPLQPDFTLKGRSLMSLRRHMANWRDELWPRLSFVQQQLPTTAKWTPTDIQPYLENTSDGLWTIDELLSDMELRVEGGIMQHCVATYIHHCARRKKSIWSVKHTCEARRVRMLTIEVEPQEKVIQQVRGKKNSSPIGAAADKVRRWADQAGLQISKWSGLEPV